MNQNKSLIILAILSIFFIGVFVGYKYHSLHQKGTIYRENNNGLTEQSNEEKSPSGAWKAFNTENFSLLIPSDWEKRDFRLYSKSNKQYQIRYSIEYLDKIHNIEERTLLEKGNLQKFETERYNRNCKASGEVPCGKVGQFRNLTTGDIAGLEYIVTMPNIVLPEGRILSDTITRIYVHKGVIYRFSTDQAHTSEVSNLDPTPFEKFQAIIEGLRIN